MPIIVGKLVHCKFFFVLRSTLLPADISALLLGSFRVFIFFFFAKTDLCAHVFRTYDVVIVLVLSSRALVIHDLQFHDCFARRRFSFAARNIWQNPLMKYWLSERQSRHT